MDARVYPSPLNRRRVSDSGDSRYSALEIFRWTMRHEALAQCFVRDVLELRGSKNTGKDIDFYWLGKVPCRTVQILGLVVGVQVWETRVIYSVDDGTGVIDCHHRPKPPPKSPRRPAKDLKDNSTPPLKPIAWVGLAIKVVGRANTWKENTQINVDKIERCKSFNEESSHWREVLQLHKCYYQSKGPFVIPEPVHLENPSLDLPRPQTPKFSESVPSSTPSTPIESSPIKPQSPVRLRHPSKLSTRKLTDQNFRLYVKHYMLNAPPFRSYMDDTSCLTTTPYLGSVDATPRPPQTQPDAPISHGFTLSYLRRVPVLADMARMVLKAELKRRERERAKKEVRTSTSSSVSREKSTRKTRRLFIKVLQEMLKEGEIIIWDGPSRPIIRDSGGDATGLWNDSPGSLTMDSTMFSQGDILSSLVEEDEGELSDPQPNEEAYIAMTPELLAPKVGQAVRALVQRTNSLPPTRAQVLEYLRNTDEALIFVGDEAVADALFVLKGQGVIRNTGKGQLKLIG